MFAISCLVVFSLHLVSSNELSRRIVQGRPADPRQWPFIVSLQVQGGHSCGGSLIHDMQWVLTAAHCFEEGVIPGTRAIVADGSQYRQVVGSYPHEGYQPNSLLNDICLLKLERPFYMSPTVKPIGLGGPVGLNQRFSVAGWGAGSNNILQACVMMTQACPNFVGNTEIFCANDFKVGVGKGDSGGPVVMDNTLVGVVSGFQHPEGIKDPQVSVGYVAIFTRVHSYIQWIQSHLNVGGTNFPNYLYV